MAPVSPRNGPRAPDPTANEAARVAADIIDGVPGSLANEVLLDVPTTAHILGGAPGRASRTTGVVDPYHRMFGHPGLHVIDGAAVGANLGVNPSLTITAMAERAMAAWPNRDEPDLRPPLGDEYRPVDPQPPLRPAVDPTRLGPAAAERV